MNFVSISSSLIKFLLISLFLLLTFNLSLAQDVVGVGIKPSIIEDKLDPNTNKTYSIELKNLSQFDQTFYLSKQDIIGVKEGGVPVFSDSNAQKNDYELSDWITLEKDSVVIPAGMSHSVAFTLSVPKDAAPGGHFGGILVSVEPPEMKAGGVNIGYKVANIISIRVSGEALDLAKIKQFSTKNFIHSKIDVDFLVKIENEGNTLVRPTGPIEIYNMFGKKVATLKFNSDLSGIFPKAIENFTVEWTDDKLGFGRYEATLTAVYGDNGQKNTVSSVVNFWILPMYIVGPALGIIVILFLMIYFGVKMYIKRTHAIMVSGSNRLLVRSRRQNEFPVLIVIMTMSIITALLWVVLLLLFS